ncbi:hypothetical protein [Teredinibacter turnerae]|uniref:hypothetical protein n=1 Tax=Teredinibacter turnerae TaxID=2426 RepID=UPI000363064C|nr:hypothetical protein [Teredinibacter turnerae]
MFKKLLISLTLFTVVLLGGCASLNHSMLMKGQIVNIESDTVTLCIGTRDGAKPGDTLAVKRSVFKEGYVAIDEGESMFELVHVGEVKIKRVINEHYATAEVLDGDIQLHDTAELQK